MTTYRILSNNTSLGKPGDTINDEKLAGLNVPALVEGGVIEAIAAKPIKSFKSQPADKE